MAKLKDEAKAYEARATHNIADLDEVSVDLDVQEEDFEFQDQDTGETKTVRQKIVEIDGERYRVPNSVLKQLKVYLEDNPNLQKFKVRKSGQGLNTDYTVIPILKP